MSEDAPAVSEAAAHALQIAYEVFREQGEWPSFQYVDHRLDREGYDATLAVREVPAELGFFDKRNPRLDSVTLTVAGMARASGSEADCRLFIRLLRWCVVREAAFEPASPIGPAQDLLVTSEEFGRESDGLPLSEVDQRKALSFLRTENLTSGSGGPGAPPEIWSATLDRHRLRAYRDIDTIDAYIACFGPEEARTSFERTTRVTMRAVSVGAGNFVVDLSRAESALISNVFNEFVNGIHIADDELERRLGRGRVGLRPLHERLVDAHRAAWPKAGTDLGSPPAITVRLNDGEIGLISRALRDLATGTDIDEWEFSIRLGEEPSAALRLASELEDATVGRSAG